MTVHPVSVRNRGEVETFAESIRLGNSEDFGIHAQHRTVDELINAALNGPDDHEYYVVKLSTDGEDVVGHIDIGLAKDRQSAFVNIRIHKAVQGYGLGQLAVQFVKDRVAALGIPVIYGTSAARSARDNRNVRFLLKQGFQERLMLLRQDIALDIDAGKLPLQPPEGVTVRVRHNTLDEVLLFEMITASKALTEEAGTTSPWIDTTSDAKTLANDYAQAIAGGRHHVIVEARDAADGFVGFVDAQYAPGDAIVEQYLSYVDPRWRGRNLSSVLKANLVCHLQEAAPEMTRMRLFLPAHLSHVAQINRRLGYEDAGFYRDWEFHLS